MADTVEMQVWCETARRIVRRESSGPVPEGSFQDKLQRVFEQTGQLQGRLEKIDVKLVDGGDQTALEQRAREHYEERKGVPVPRDEVFDGSVTEQKALAEDFAQRLPALKGGDTSQYNLWSGMGKPGEDKQHTPRGKAESQRGFVMQQTEDFASAIWEVRNVAGFIDSEKSWPWDPGYHLVLARWLEERQATSGWPSVEEIGHKLDELRRAQVGTDSRVKIATDGDGELIGMNRKVGDAIFESPSADLARRIGSAMVPVQSFGLEVHDNPKATVQWQVEIPHVIKQAEALQKELQRLVVLCRDLAECAPDDEVRRSLDTAAGDLQVGALRYKVGARMLKTAIERTSEDWKASVGWTNAELMREGRELVLGALRRLLGLLEELAR
jgi:hypothetical protein